MNMTDWMELTIDKVDCDLAKPMASSIFLPLGMFYQFSEQGPTFGTASGYVRPSSG
jgi:hypothetical protein